VEQEEEEEERCSACLTACLFSAAADGAVLGLPPAMSSMGGYLFLSLLAPKNLSSCGLGCGLAAPLVVVVVSFPIFSSLLMLGFSLQLRSVSALGSVLGTGGQPPAIRASCLFLGNGNDRHKILRPLVSPVIRSCLNEFLMVFSSLFLAVLSRASRELCGS